MCCRNAFLYEKIYFLLLHYLDKIGEGRQVVAESILECSTRECTKWIPFVFSFLLKQEWTVEYFALPEFQCAAVFANQVTRYNLLVEQIPLVLVAEGTDTLIVQFPGSIVISVRFYLLDVLFSAQYLAAALVERVIIQVTHNEHFCFRVLCMDRIANVFYDAGSKFSQWRRSGATVA